MTHEEAYNIISEFCFTGYEDNKKPTAKLFNAIRELVCEVHENAELRDYKARLEKENTKLKAEIEQYKSALTTWNNANNEMLKFNQELKDKIEQLKEKLDKLDKYNSELCIELTVTMDKLCLAEKEIERLRK